MMLTYSGRLIDPTDLDLSRVMLIDVAYALDHVYRWGGHASPPITVAQHCVAGARWYVRCGMFREALAFLHHDDGEAFLGDMCRDLKQHPAMRWFRDLEHQTSERLRLHFAPETGGVDMSEIKNVDDASLIAEYRVRMHPKRGEKWRLPEGEPLPGWCFEPSETGPVWVSWLELHTDLRRTVRRAG